MESKVFNMDCIEGMKQYPDNYFDLAVVDPPYGVGETWKKNKHSKFAKHNSSYKNNSIPDQSYFIELFRVSKHQIIWGANYYINYLPADNHWICWDKHRDFKTQHASEGELAWHSFNIPIRIIKKMWNGACVCEKRSGIHPHEKPVGLYDWIYKNYLPNGGKVIDTHLGSGSNRIAAHKAGNIDFTGYEIDKDYFDAADKRYQDFIKQLTLF